MFCGWDRAQEKMCARVGADGETERWAGRYSCGRECEMLFDCGIHPCQDVSALFGLRSMLIIV